MKTINIPNIFSVSTRNVRNFLIKCPGSCLLGALNSLYILYQDTKSIEYPSIFSKNAIISSKKQPNLFLGVNSQGREIRRPPISYSVNSMSLAGRETISRIQIKYFHQMQNNMLMQKKTFALQIFRHWQQ